MKTWLIVLIFAVLGAAAGVGGTVLELGVSPRGQGDTTELDESVPHARLIVDNADFDFGSMAQETKRQHTFVIKNAGEAPLKLTKLSTTCKCTLGSFDRGDVPPGQSTAVTLEWTAHTLEGYFRQSEIIETNDPRRPQITLTVSGKVIRPLEIVPEQLVVPGVAASEPKTAEIKLFSTDRADFKIDGPELANPETAKHFELAIEPIGAEELKEHQAQSGQRVHLTIKPGLPLGLVRQTIRLHSNLPERPLIEVPVELTVRGDISISGPLPAWDAEHNLLTLGDFGSVHSSVGAKAELVLIVRGPNRGQTDFRPLQVDPEILQVRVSPPKAGTTTTVRLTVEIPKGTKPMDRLGSQQGKLGKITLSTGHPKAPELSLYVKFVVED